MPSLSLVFGLALWAGIFIWFYGWKRRFPVNEKQRSIAFLKVFAILILGLYSILVSRNPAEWRKVREWTAMLISGDVDFTAYNLLPWISWGMVVVSALVLLFSLAPPIERRPALVITSFFLVVVGLLWRLFLTG